MDAISLLEQQHRNVEALFAELERNGPDGPTLLSQLALDMAAHMAIEQNIFYPAIRDLDEELVSASFEEHAIAELALKRLMRTSPGDPAFLARVSSLREIFERHVTEEEEELFPEVEEELESHDLANLGAELESAFASAQQEGFAALVPAGFARTSADDALDRFSSSDGRGEIERREDEERAPRR
jgi:hypothetical protein